jgi:hypothetical protein
MNAPVPARTSIAAKKAAPARAWKEEPLGAKNRARAPAIKATVPPAIWTGIRPFTSLPLAVAVEQAY